MPVNSKIVSSLLKLISKKHSVMGSRNLKPSKFRFPNFWETAGSIVVRDYNYKLCPKYQALPPHLELRHFKQRTRNQTDLHENYINRVRHIEVYSIIQQGISYLILWYIWCIYSAQCGDTKMRNWRVELWKAHFEGTAAKVVYKITYSI